MRDHMQKISFFKMGYPPLVSACGARWLEYGARPAHVPQRLCFFHTELVNAWHYDWLEIHQAATAYSKFVSKNFRVYSST